MCNNRCCFCPNSLRRCLDVRPTAGTAGIARTNGTSRTNGIRGLYQDRRVRPDRGFYRTARTYRRNWTARTSGENGPGPQGPPGPPGVSAFGYYYSTAEQRVDDTEPAVFTSVHRGTFFFTSPSSIVTITETGYYKIDFQVSASTGGGGVWGIALDDATDQSRTFLTRSANNQISGDLIVAITTAPTAVQLVNLSGGSVTLANGLANEPGTSVSASMTILKLL